MRAAKSICLLLNTFYEYSSFKDYTFQNWLEIHHFLNYINKNFNMIEEIDHIKTKCEHPKAVRNQAMFDLLKKEVKVH